MPGGGMHDTRLKSLQTQSGIAFSVKAIMQVISWCSIADMP